jgi:putative transposase
MSVRDIATHLSGLYGVDVGRDTISRVTDAVLEDVTAWRTRPLEAVYPIVYFDCLMVKVRQDRSVRTRACYPAIGVTVDGERQALGIRWQETEGAKVWLAVLNDLHQRGVKHAAGLLRRRAGRLPGGDRGRLPRGVGADLHHPPNPLIAALRRLQGPQARRRQAEARLSGGQRRRRLGGARGVRPGLGRALPDDRRVLAGPLAAHHAVLALPADLRRAVYTTNSIEILNRQIRKAIKTRGHFPDEQAATKLSYLAIQRAEMKWRTAYNWTNALRGLKTHFGDDEDVRIVVELERRSVGLTVRR